MWDQRYSEPEYAYGTEPNEFLVSVHERLPPRGRVLCLAEGQGRNAVYLARLGHEVDAVDASRVGMERAQELARTRGVTIGTHVADLAEYDLGDDAWDAIVTIFGHLPSPLRQRVHRAVVHALSPGGVFVMEAYSKAQLGRGTGGPPVAELLYDLDEVRAELDGLRFSIARERERDVHEGKYHDGRSSVLQILAVKAPRSTHAA